MIDIHILSTTQDSFRTDIVGCIAQKFHNEPENVPPPPAKVKEVPIKLFLCFTRKGLTCGDKIEMFKSTIKSKTSSKQCEKIS